MILARVAVFFLNCVPPQNEATNCRKQTKNDVQKSIKHIIYLIAPRSPPGQDVWMYVDFDRFEGHLGAKIGPKSDLGAILGTKIGPRWPQNRPRRGPKRNQEGQKRKAASPRRPRTPPDEIFLAMVARLGAVLGSQIDRNRPKNGSQN